MSYNFCQRCCPSHYKDRYCDKCIPIVEKEREDYAIKNKKIINMENWAFGLPFDQRADAFEVVAELMEEEGHSSSAEERRSWAKTIRSNQKKNKSK